MPSSRHRRQRPQPEVRPVLRHRLQGRRAEDRWVGNVGAVLGDDGEDVIGDAWRREDPCRRVQTAVAPRAAEPPTRLLDDHLGRGVVPDATEHDHRAVVAALGDHHPVERDALAARFVRRHESAGDVAPPALEHALPGDHADLRALEARRARHVQLLGRNEVHPLGRARSRPRARAALGPPPPAEGGCAHHADRRLAVARERDDRPPAGATRAVVVGAVDPVEDPLPRGQAGDRPDLLADEGVLRLFGEDEPEHRLLDELVGDRHGSAVGLGREAHLVGPEVEHRDAVRLVRQPVREDEVGGEAAHAVTPCRSSRGARVDELRLELEPDLVADERDAVADPERGATDRRAGTEPVVGRLVHGEDRTSRCRSSRG